MSPNARVAAMSLALILTLLAIVLDLTGVAERAWWQLALPAFVVAILVFLLIRETRVR